MPSAHVQSLAAIAEFRAALAKFAHEVHQALDSTSLEVRHGLEWILDEQPRYWQQQIRQRGDDVAQAKADLHRCRSMPAPDGHTPSCIEQKKALDKAQRRLREAEEKSMLTREWGRVIEREVIEYEGRASLLAGELDAQIPRSMATLDRILDSLDEYLAVEAASGGRQPPVHESQRHGPDYAQPGVPSAERDDSVPTEPEEVEHRIPARRETIQHPTSNDNPSSSAPHP